MKRWIGAVWLGVVLAHGSPAHAQQGDPSAAPAARPADAQSRARMYFSLGKQLYGQKKYAEALEALKEALKHWDHRTIHFNLALTCARMGKKLEAGRYVRSFLKRAPPAERKLPAILARVLKHSAVLRVKATHPSAEIYIDGKRVGRGRVYEIVEPGVRRVEIRTAGRMPVRRNVVLPGGTEQVWDQKAQGPFPGPAPRPGPGPGTGSGPVSGSGAGPGSGTLPALRRRHARVHWAYFAVAAGLAAAAAGAATGTGVKALAVNDDFKATGRTDRDLRDRGKLFENVTNALWGVAAGAAAAAVVLAVFTRWRQQEKPSAVSAGPMIGPGSVGLSVTLEH